MVFTSPPKLWPQTIMKPITSKQSVISTFYKRIFHKDDSTEGQSRSLLGLYSLDVDADNLASTKSCSQVSISTNYFSAQSRLF